MGRRDIERQIDEFQSAYTRDPEFIERHFRLPSLMKLVTSACVVGVARFIELPSFQPERLFTLTYRATSVAISAVVGNTSLWGSMPSVYQVVGTRDWGVQQGEPFDPGKAWRRSVVVALSSPVCPPVLRSWESLRAASSNAGNCVSDTLDGVSYRHRLADRNSCLNAEWHNPEAPQHVSQLRLIEAYEELLQGAGLETP